MNLVITTKYKYFISTDTTPNASSPRRTCALVGGVRGVGPQAALTYRDVGMWAPA